MEEWQRLDEEEPVRDSGFRDQASWNALLLRTGSAVSPRGSLAEGSTGVDSIGEATGTDRGPKWKIESFPSGGGAVPGLSGPALHELFEGGADA